MSISNLIQKRKSCRAYTQQPIDLEMVRSLLETAKWAPSGVNHQPTKTFLGNIAHIVELFAKD